MDASMNTNPGLTIETERLLLRVPQASDFDGYCELMGDEEAARHIGGHMTRAAAWRKFLQMPGAWMVQGFGMFAAIDRATGEWLGQAGPWQPEGWPGTEVGWSFKRSAWGKGYASEAAVATIDWAFDHLAWTEVIHTIGPANVASQALARRLGSTLLGPGRLPDPYAEVPVEIWGQSREQWRARRAANREP